ncbi:Cytoplasmic axial filament protein CafA and Ribonuclease G [hydrothermal vent metagenome]|uniref:Cytoplasmic axial filament protein CafA and Ribonuclease G n=1 Tax=hydrothermal vent metagenome TaxID=652676 RepID=A0A3B0R217_9ZZZZ
MSSEILINSAIGETRLALMEDDKPVEIRLYRDHEPTLVGAVYYGRVTSLNTAFQAAFIDIGQGQTGFLPLTLLPKRPGGKPKDLTSLLTEGQKIIVQVTADAAGGKSAKLTGRIEIVSSALILHPFREGAFISSRIKDPTRRQALKTFASGLNLHDMGMTLRTEAQYLSHEDISKTATRLIHHWRHAVENRDKKKVPFLLSQGPDSLLQILREYGSAKHDKIIFDQPATLKKAQDWSKEFAPDLLPRMTLHQDNAPLFEYYGVEEEIDRLFDKKIPIPSGAWITLEQTEALTAVDINMADANISNDPAKQRFGVNVAAAREIFRQIRLRGISGLIVIDFINMQGKSDVSNLLTVIDNLIQNDPVQLQRSNLSAFGLLELARKASHTPLTRQILAPTRPMATVETAALALLRKSALGAAAKPGIPLVIKVGADVKNWLEDHPELLEAFVRRTGSRIDFKEE